MTKVKCIECCSQDMITLSTYKRNWFFCKSCGAGFPKQRKFYPLSLLPIKHYKKSALDAASMYDYFTTDAHVDYAIQAASRFTREYLEPWQMDIAGKSILDISGGNGIFIDELRKKGADVTLTEINQPTIDWVNKNLDFNCYHYNFNEEKLCDIVSETYDYVFLRAAIMFCEDLGDLAHQVKKILKPGGKVLVHRSIVPTLGVATRVQYDEFSYYALRQPDSVIKTFEAQGYSLKNRHDRTDPSLYVYDNDLLWSWMIPHYYYEIKNAIQFHNRSHRVFNFPARDRRMSTMLFELME